MQQQQSLATVTTEQIQKYLDENKQLILAILDNQNSGKLAESAQYQAQLQNNLMYLAAVADAQPQTPGMRPQMIPHAGVPPGSVPYMQQPQMFPSKGPPPPHFTPQQVREVQQQQMIPPSFQNQMAMRTVSSADGKENKHDGAASEDHNNNNKNSATEHASGDSEPPAQLKD